MKTRLLIVIGIVIASIGLGTSAYVINVQSQCESLLGDTHYPRPLTFWNCLDYVKTTENSNPFEVDSGWITDEDYCGEWCNQKELYQMGCNQQILEHIYKYTNLLDDDFDGMLMREWAGLPEGVSEEKYQECMDFIYEQRSSVELENIEPEPEPEPISEEERSSQEKQNQARIQTQNKIIEDYKGNQHQIDAINNYREEFELDYFLELFVIPNKQNFEQNEVINFVIGQWGYQPEKCISYSVKSYFKPYDNYDPFYVEKISEWEDKQECSHVISSDSNGYLIVNLKSIPGIPEEHQTCINPGEYRILVRNLNDKPQVEWGYYTCQRDKLVGEPQPWMEIPE